MEVKWSSAACSEGHSSQSQSPWDLKPGWRIPQGLHSSGYKGGGNVDLSLEVLPISRRSGLKTPVSWTAQQSSMCCLLKGSQVEKKRLLGGIAQRGFTGPYKLPALD